MTQRALANYAYRSGICRFGFNRGQWPGDIVRAFCAKFFFHPETLLMNKTAYIAILALMFVSTAANAEVKTLCKSNENTVWSCQAGTKVYSVCSSKELTRTAGYLQYRAGTTNKIELKFPASFLHPNGNFEFGLLAHGASLSFSNAGYTYTISEDIKGDTAIFVDTSSKTLATIHCRNSTETLTLNSTIDLFKSAGISK